MTKYSFQFLIVLIAALTLQSCGYYFSNTWKVRPDKHYRSDGVVSKERQIPDYSNHFIINHWANQPIPDWHSEGKVSAPRVMMAKLMKGNANNEVNEYLLGKTPWGKNGTDWALNKHGDYDFSEVPLQWILQLYGNDRAKLTAPAYDNLLNRLLTHSGNKPHQITPGSLGMMRETENHILMGETSRYLKNQWLHEHGDTSWLYDNERNGLNAWWMALLNQKLEKGFFEFNADPYSGYSITALLTFHTFCHSAQVKAKCTSVLDEVMLKYAYGSMELKRYPPYRRRYERVKRRAFTSDPVSDIVKMLLLKEKQVDESVQPTRHHYHHCLIALLSDYRIPDTTAHLMLHKKENYMVQYGHGKRAPGEIYSGGEKFLIGAGGSMYTMLSQQAPRPITLFLNDGVRHIDSCFHIDGKGKRPNWKMTGVYRNFGVAGHVVSIPEQYSAKDSSGHWKIFEPYTSDSSFHVVVYSATKAGLIYVIDNDNLSAQMRLQQTIEQNKRQKQSKTFVYTNGDVLNYNLCAPKTKWIIQSVNGKKMDRCFVKWSARVKQM
jgi:hypothetical protein